MVRARSGGDEDDDDKDDRVEEKIGSVLISVTMKRDILPADDTAQW